MKFYQRLCNGGEGYLPLRGDESRNLSAKCGKLQDEKK